MSPAGEAGAERIVRVASPDGRVHVGVDRRGGGLHALTLDGSPLVETYAADRPVPACSGSLLFPWPNRVRGGRWTRDGVSHQLDVDEPELGNANHGFVLGATFDVGDRAADRVQVTTVVEPRPGYPFQVALDTTYTALDDGVRVDHTVRNLSAGPAPVALGAHPYLRVADVATSEVALTVRAGRHLPVDDRLVPVADVPVDDAVDLRDAPVLGTRPRNTCYHDLELVGGAHRHALRAPDGRAVELWADPSFGFVQVYVTDLYPDAVTGSRWAVAVEPMTAAPDALNSGLGLRWLAPGEAWQLRGGSAPSAGEPCRRPPTSGHVSLRGGRGAGRTSLATGRAVPAGRRCARC